MCSGPRSREPGAGALLNLLDVEGHLTPQYFAPGSEAVTPLQMFSFFAHQPASVTVARLSAVIGVTLRVIVGMVFPPGVLKSTGLALSGAYAGSTLTLTSLTAVPAHSWSAAWPAAVPRALLFFQMSTYCLPSATLLRFASSPSWPLSGGYP